MADTELAKHTSPIPDDVDPAETAEWLESLDYVLERKGPERARQLLEALEEAAIRNGVELPFTANTPYINTIPADKQPRYPGQPRDRTPHQELHPLERDGDGHAGQPRGRRHRRTHFDVRLVGHAVRSRASITSSAAAVKSGFDGDQIYFQGHASPGMYAPRVPRRAGSPSSNLINFRRELAAGGGLSSYPHPWLMPNFWEFPTVSMGLGPIMAIYQARFNRYLTDRGINDTVEQTRLGLHGRRRDATNPNRSAPSRSPRASSSTI